MATYTIRPLDCGTIYSGRREYWGGSKTGTVEEAVAIIWIIEGGPFPVVVDTSFQSIENASIGKQWRCTRTPEQEPLAQFKKAGVDPNDVGIVLLSHMHWDHTGNLHLFPNAKKYIWRRELQYWAAPCRTQAKPFEAPSHPSWHTAPWVQHRITFEPVDEPTEVLPGITYFPVPGHTIGECAVAVKAQSGTYVLPGDILIFQYNPDFPAPWPELPSHCVVGQTYSIPLASASLQRIKTTASSPQHILAQHDKRIFDVEVYR